MKLFLIPLIVCLFCVKTIMPSAVTYDFSGGRFGDNLVAYAHAKWISYKFNIPLLYKPFPCSDKLAMHEKELLYINEEDKYKTRVKVNQKCNITKDGDVLHIVPYFPESELELKQAQFAHAFAVDWSDRYFISILREHIKPIVDLNQFFIPQDHISVAVHIRRGTGYDIEHLDGFKAMTFHYPLKFISDLYYINQIKKISELCSGKKLYVCIFTDHTNPYDIFETYKREINNPNIIFDFKINNNLNDEINILSDFFVLTEFDCLIRSDSNFTIMASKLANYKIEISPEDALVDINKIRINNKMAIAINENNMNRLVKFTGPKGSSMGNINAKIAFDNLYNKLLNYSSVYKNYLQVIYTGDINKIDQVKDRIEAIKKEALCVNFNIKNELGETLLALNPDIALFAEYLADPSKEQSLKEKAIEEKLTLDRAIKEKIEKDKLEKEKHKKVNAKTKKGRK